MGGAPRGRVLFFLLAVGRPGSQERVGRVGRVRRAGSRGLRLGWVMVDGGPCRICTLPFHLLGSVLSP